MTDFEKLMILLKVPKEKWEDLFCELCSNNSTLALEFDWDGKIFWGIL